MIKESFLYLIWNNQLFNPKGLCSVDDEVIEILDKGNLNEGDGPDILEAKIRVDETILVGSIEFHVNASDWLKHKHNDNPKYKNVILHIVWLNDIEIPSLKCPTLELKGRVSKYYLNNYIKLLEYSNQLPCAFFIKELKEEWFTTYRMNILRERFNIKLNWIEQEFSEVKLDRIYQVFVTVFGMPQNKYAYKILTERIPYRIINKYKNDKHKLEAILFGVAGLLPANSKDMYVVELNKTYTFLCTLYHFEQMSRSDWVFLRVRPNAFPTIRLSLLADLFSKIQTIENFVLLESYTHITKIFRELKPSEFWKTHYVFNKVSQPREKRIGKSMVLKLWINSIIPLRILYTETKEDVVNTAYLFLEQQYAENNKITRLMTSNGFLNKNAAHSQFNLHKYKYYCIPRKCLNCGIGYKIIGTHD